MGDTPYSKNNKGHDRDQGTCHIFSVPRWNQFPLCLLQVPCPEWQGSEVEGVTGKILEATVKGDHLDKAERQKWLPTHPPHPRIAKGRHQQLPFLQLVHKVPGDPVTRLAG